MVKVSESITEADAPIVQMRHITKSFPGVRALDDVSMTIKKGEVHILLGENGAGKSTLMKILTGVYNADSGEILLNGKKVNVDNIHEAQKLRIGTVFQENSLIPHLTVLAQRRTVHKVQLQSPTALALSSSLFYPVLFSHSF